MKAIGVGCQVMSASLPEELSHASRPTPLQRVVIGMRRLRRIVAGCSLLALAFGATGSWADDQNVVSLTCRGMEVRKAINILGTVSALRVVVDPKVPSKRITLSFKDLPPEDALRTVVAAAGLSYRKLGNAYIVEPKKSTALSA